MSRTAKLLLPGLLLVLPTAAGCGGGVSDVPGEGGPAVSLSELRPIPGAGGGAARLVVVMPAEVGLQQRVWAETARREASVRGAVLTIRYPAEGKSQADLVRRAAREGASALIVVPGDVERLGPAMAEARGRGVGVLTIRDPVPVDGEAIPVVERGDLQEAAAALVEAVAGDAPKVGLSADGPALAIYLADFPEAAGRAELLVEAAREAGIRVVGEGPMAVSGGEDEAAAAIRRVLADHPDLAMVLAGDDRCFAAALTVRNAEEDDTRMVVTGFLVDPAQFDEVRFSFASAGAFADDQVLGIFAVRNALAMARGESVPDRIVTPLPVRRAPGPPADRPPFDPDEDF